MGTSNAMDFDNCSYFILPLRIGSFEKFDSYLHMEGSKWSIVGSGFATQYLLFYAGKMNEDGDDRFHMYRYNKEDVPPIYLFDNKVEDPGKRPTLGDVSLYVFGRDIAFLEFQVFYHEMSEDKVAEFVYSFRSLRNPNTLPQGSDCIRLKEAVALILPEKESDTTLCFSNPSDIKMQANILTLLSVPGHSDENCRSDCCRIAHGYRSVSTSEGDAVSDYDRCLHLNAYEYWGICPDGMAYINNAEKKDRTPYIYNTLCTDYHFMYLLLLNQRFSAISYIEEISRLGKDDKEREKITEIYPNVVDLRTHYSFRVISDEFFVQTVYSNTYQVLEIEALLKDLEDANGQFNELSKKREKRVADFIVVVSILAAVSAFADFAAYLQMFGLGKPHWFSLIGIGAILMGAVLVIFKPWQRKR